MALNLSVNFLPPYFNDSILYVGLDDWGTATSPVHLWVLYNQLTSSVKCTLYDSSYRCDITYVNNILSVSTDTTLHKALYDSNKLNDGSGSSFNVNLFSIRRSLLRLLGGWTGVVDGTMNVFHRRTVREWVRGDFKYMTIAQRIWP